MHDPMTVAFEIKLPFRSEKNKYKSLITIWHVDPKKDGTDDSCGWFIRQRHIPKDLVDKVRKEFKFEFDQNYWFNESGYPVFSVMGITLCMYSRAAWNVFMWKHNGNPTNKANRQYKKFMRKYMFDIMHFAENPNDSLHSAITMKYEVEKKEERINHFTSIVLADIMRKLRPWYRHARWHIHHWKIQFHPWQQFRRRHWDMCCVCGKRGFKESAMSDWDGTKMWHQSCDRSMAHPTPHPITNTK